MKHKTVSTKKKKKDEKERRNLPFASNDLPLNTPSKSSTRNNKLKRYSHQCLLSSSSSSSSFCTCFFVCKSKAHNSDERNKNKLLHCMVFVPATACVYINTFEKC
ncbi:hypothetical protein GQ457_15G007200 [Hibiscus cannabinus]